MKKNPKQAQLGVPHSETQVGLQSYFNWGQVSVGGERRTYFVDGGEQLGWGHRTTLKDKTELAGRSGRSGRVGSVLTEIDTTSWLHLASWNLPDSQLR